MVLTRAPQTQSGDIIVPTSGESLLGHERPLKYLTRRMPLANLSEIYAHGDESACGGSAAQFCSKRVFRVSTPWGSSATRIQPEQALDHYVFRNT